MAGFVFQLVPLYTRHKYGYVKDNTEQCPENAEGQPADWPIPLYHPPVRGINLHPLAQDEHPLRCYPTRRITRIMFRIADALFVDVLHPIQYDLHNIFFILFHLLNRWII